jgi:hypothetical protein
MAKRDVLGTLGLPAVSKETEDRQRALNDVCRRVLDSFVGRKITPTVVAEAESALRHALDDAIRAGKYVLPDGLMVDRIELGENMRLQVYFRRGSPEDLFSSLFPGLYAPKSVAYANGVDDTQCEDQEPEAKTMKDRFEAVVAELDDSNEEEP